MCPGTSQINERVLNMCTHNRELIKGRASVIVDCTLVSVTGSNSAVLFLLKNTKKSVNKFAVKTGYLNASRYRYIKGNLKLISQNTLLKNKIIKYCV